jgi:hypothetical protein
MKRLALRKFALSALMAWAVLLLAATQAMAMFTCSTVARRLQLDPKGNVFRDDLDVNGSGDVVFAAKAEDGRERLYLYRGTGAKEVVAEAGGPGPAGIVFRVKRPFSSLHVGPSGSLSLVGRDSTGPGCS